MLTLQELKHIVDAPCPGMKTPTVKNLKKDGKVLIRKKLKENAQILVFKNGYAIYQVSRAATVFSVHLCREYQYASGENGCVIPEGFFDQKEWYVRLTLEGEDRLCRNQEVKEQGNTVSYSVVSEEWNVLCQKEASPLEQVLQEESMKEILEILTEQQRTVICGVFFEQKTQKELSEELCVSVSAISRSLSRALCRVRREYSDIQCLLTENKCREGR